jgi:hypothetical protein
MSSLEFMRTHNRADVELPSGIGVTLALVRARDCLIAGGIPTGILREMESLAEAAQKAAEAETNGDGPKKKIKEPEPSPEAIERGMWLRREMVRRSIRRIAPSLAELDGPDEDEIPMWVVDRFDQADFDLLSEYALRATPLPAGSQA